MKTSDQNELEGGTQYTLRGWGDNLIGLLKAEYDVYRYDSIEKALSDWKELGIITESKYGRMKTDFWGTPYRWEKFEKVNGERIIRVGSHGSNGGWEGGEGDDLYVEIRIPAGKDDPTMYLKPLVED